jgi:hypothetical protein
MSDPTPEMAYLAGAYEMRARLLTSPRFNKSQREVIEEQAQLIKDKMNALNMSFTQGSST